MRRRGPIWRAEGCPPYPYEQQNLLEAALGRGDRVCEIVVNGRQYVVELSEPRRQILKADRTKVRRVERELPGPSPLASFAAQLRGAPAWCVATRMRRHALLLLLGTVASWLGTCFLVMSLSGSEGNKRLLDGYMHSFSFWSCFMQVISASSGTKIPICIRSQSIARRVARWNFVAALVSLGLALGCIAERVGLFGGMLLNASSFLLINNLAVGTLVLSALLHLNLSAHAFLIRRARRIKREGSRKEPPLPVVAPLDTSGASLPTAPSPNHVEDDGRRVQLDPHVQPQDDSTYLMYHGTTPAAADSIERFGFVRSKDGMLGEGVYLSRDVTKAAAYPLHVREDHHDGRVILECLVNVGKVKRIDCLGHPMQKTWMILGYDTAWVPPHCGMVPSGLEEDCVFAPERIIVLRRVQVKAAARVSAAKKAIAAQNRAEKAKEESAKMHAKVAAASGGRGEKVKPSTVRQTSGWRAAGFGSKGRVPQDGVNDTMKV